MLGVNGMLFITTLLEKVSARILMAAGLLLAVIGLAVLPADRSDGLMYLGVSLTSAGTGLVLPVIAFLAAGASPQKLGVVMGGLAAASGLGQTLGAAAGGWLVGALAHRSFGWLTLPLILMAGLVVVRPGWWSVVRAAPTLRSQRLEVRVDGAAHLNMVGVDGSSPFAPTKFGRKNKHLAETLGAFFLSVRKKYGNLRAVEAGGAPA